MKFTVVLHTDDGHHYSATAPDLPGCSSAGNSLDDALRNVTEAIELHVEGLLGCGGGIPPSLAVSRHQTNPDYGCGVWALVDVAVERYFGPAEKITLALPRLLLAQIDEQARLCGQSRNDFLLDAARTALEQHRQPEDCAAPDHA